MSSPRRSFVKPQFNSSSLSSESFDHLWWGSVLSLTPSDYPKTLSQYANLPPWKKNKISKSYLERINYKEEQKKRDTLRKKRIEKERKEREMEKMGLIEEREKKYHTDMLKDIQIKNLIERSKKIDSFFEKKKPMESVPQGAYDCNSFETK